MGSKNLLEDNRSHSWRNSFAIIMPSCCRFWSLVGVSVTDIELRFINMVLSSAISNVLTNSFSETATVFDLRDSDFTICEDRLQVYSSYCFLMLHICSKEFKFWVWSVLPMVHLVTALFSDCSPRWSTAVWRLYFTCNWTEKMISSPLCSKSLFLIWCTYQLPCLAWLCLLVEK